MSLASSVEQSSASRPVELAIGGMTCAACAARVERKLNKLDGVTATVNYATEKATVHSSGPADVAELIGQVERAGYRAELVVPNEPNPADEPGSDRVRYLWRRLVVALLLGTPLGDLSITLALV
ncbi:MAG: cation transporter, partial [Sciscionella sp.]